MEARLARTTWICNANAEQHAGLPEACKNLKLKAAEAPVSAEKHKDNDMLKVLTVLATLTASVGAHEHWVLAEGNIATGAGISFGRSYLMNEALDIDSWCGVRLFVDHGAAFSIESGVCARMYCCNNFSIGPELCGGLAHVASAGLSSAWISYMSFGVRTETKLDERMSLVVRGTLIPLGNRQGGVYPGVHIGLKVGF